MSKGILFIPYCWRWYRLRLYILLTLISVLNLQRTYRNISMTVFVLLIHLLLYVYDWQWQLLLWYCWSYDLSLWWWRLIMWTVPSFEITFDAHDDVMITWQFRLCIFCTVYLYTRLCSQLDPLICSFIPPDTSHIFGINEKIFMRITKSKYIDWYGYSVLNTISYLIWSNTFSILYPLPHPVSPIIVTDVRHPHPYT